MALVIWHIGRATGLGLADEATLFGVVDALLAKSHATSTDLSS